MGLTRRSVGSGAKNTGALAPERCGKKLVALAGNPNVGKSTLFNALTDMHQHTGNWPGKTVGSAYGYMTRNEVSYIFADIPGTYSLVAHSKEEEVARDALLFGEADAVLVVCDATCLQRCMNLALQIRETTGRLIICVNLLDEAERKGLEVDMAELQRRLGLPVIGMSAGRKIGIDSLLDAVERLQPGESVPLCCGCGVEDAIMPLCAYFAAYHPPLPPRWLAMRVLEGDASLLDSLEKYLGMDRNDEELCLVIAQCEKQLAQLGISRQQLSDLSACALSDAASAVCEGIVTQKKVLHDRDRAVDRILTHRIWGWPVMVLLLAGVLWLTITGANYPSALLSKFLFGLGDIIASTLRALYFPEWLVSLLIDGVYRTSAWVVSVMLPPMAIFFPLFTLLEDLGYLPRVAFNLDGFFKRCGACGKQALTLCMGFGCNAAGVIGCRIIDSPRERLIAILTNSFAPCNGRFPTMIALISIFFSADGIASSVLNALMLTLFVVLGIAMALLSSRLLSKTVLKGVPSSFTLELPPYRRPKIGEVIVRSILDRTLFVLGRALKAAAPAGLLIWLLANVSIGGSTLLGAVSAFLQPAGRLVGLDGAILLAFIIGLPANEIVVPAILMCYLSGGSLVNYGSFAELRGILLANGWTTATALCMLLFTLMHWPCSTTLMTIKKETGSRFYTVLSAVLPTLFGVCACILVNLLFRLAA